MKSEAVFDILYIGKKLQLKMLDFSLSEINFFSYLSCLLSMYDGKTMEIWKYNFIKSTFGSPYSSDLNLALAALYANKSLIKLDGIDSYYKLSSKGESDLEFYSTLQTFSLRIPYLEAACASMSLLPFGLIKQSIANEPVLRSANISHSRRSLLDENSPATQSLHNQFALLKIALEDKYEDLIIPAVVWIESLNPESQFNR